MGKSKRPPREKRQRKERAADASQEQPPIPVPDPPRKNLALLLVSSFLLLGFLCYLAVIAWTATR